jgi:DNA-binding transcriptional ArsR family regulator
MLPRVGRAASDSSVFTALASETRRTLLDALFEREATVGELVDRLGISQPGVSQQLAVLKAAGLVDERAEGRFRYYRLAAEPLAEVARWMERYRAFWDASFDALGHVLDDMDDRPGTKPRKTKGRHRPRRKS